MLRSEKVGHPTRQSSNRNLEMRRAMKSNIAQTPLPIQSSLRGNEKGGFP